MADTSQQKQNDSSQEDRSQKPIDAPSLDDILIPKGPPKKSPQAAQAEESASGSPMDAVQNAEVPPPPAINSGSVSQAEGGMINQSVSAGSKKSAAPSNLPTEFSAPQNDIPTVDPSVVGEESSEMQATSDVGEGSIDVQSEQPAEPGAPLQEVSMTEDQGDALLQSLSDQGVAFSDRKTTAFKIITVVVVLLFLVGVTFFGVFAYNRWVKPTFDGAVTDSNTDSDSGDSSNDSGTQTRAFDTDGDSLPDTWEIENGLDPDDPSDALDDPDFDQLRNREEYTYDTDPNDPDSDNDSYRDGVEVQGGFNPNGPGKLNTQSGSGQTSGVSNLAGSWSGTFTGSTLTAQDLDFSLDESGEIIGTFTFVDDRARNVFSRGKGEFNFNSSTSLFTATVRVKGFFEQESVDYDMTLNGQVREEGQVAGTWNISPDREVPWLLQDRGTFQLVK